MNAEQSAAMPRGIADPVSPYQLLNAIGAIQSRFIEKAPQNVLLGEILGKLMALTESEVGFLGEVRRSPAGETYFKMQVVSDSAWKAMARDFYERNAPIGMEFDNLHGMFGAVSDGGRVVIENALPEGRLPAGHPPIRSFLGLPISCGGELLGMVGLANRAQGYSTDLAEFLQPLLATCGSVIKAWRVDSWRREIEVDLQRHAMVFDNISDGVILTDDEGIVLDCNRAAEEMFNLPRNKLVGVPLGFLVAAQDGNPVADAVAAIGTAGRWSGQLIMQQKSGERQLYESSALRLQGATDEEGLLAWFNRDVTERERARTRLEVRSLELNAILDLSPAGYVFIDAAGRVAYVNPAFEVMTGLTAHKAIGMTSKALEDTLSELCGPALPPKTLAGEGDDTLQLIRPRFTILRRIRSCLQDSAGLPQGKVLCFQDITREAEVDRLKSEFLSTAAHELRTPMSSVLGFAELLLNRQVDANKQHQYIGIIHRQAGRLAAIINELLDLARIDAMEGKDFKIAEHNLAPIIRHVLDELLVPGDERKVEVKLPPALPPVWVDSAKLHLVLTNVLSNAYKYSFGQGTIELEVYFGKGDRAGWLGIVVRDRGIGMTPDQLEHVFKRFWRADTSGKVPGTGLGMSLVKEVINIFKGAVDVESCAGYGTQVTLWLPAMTA